MGLEGGVLLVGVAGVWWWQLWDDENVMGWRRETDSLRQEGEEQEEVVAWRRGCLGEYVCPHI